MHEGNTRDRSRRRTQRVGELGVVARNDQVHRHGDHETARDRLALHLRDRRLVEIARANASRSRTSRMYDSVGVRAESSACAFCECPLVYIGDSQLHALRREGTPYAEADALGTTGDESRSAFKCDGHDDPRNRRSERGRRVSMPDVRSDLEIRSCGEAKARIFVTTGANFDRIAGSFTIQPDAFRPASPDASSRRSAHHESSSSSAACVDFTSASSPMSLRR